MNLKKISNYPKEYFELFLSLKEKENDTVREFIRQIERLSNTIAFYDDKERDKFKGDSLEILSEIFFNAFSNDESIGLREYVPTDAEEDFGVDAIGINVNDHISMVQVKYRSNPLDIITYTDIAKTFCSGVISFSLDPFQNHTVYVFTTANSISHQCQTVLGDRLVVINREIIKIKIDNNRNFWKFAFDEVFKYLNK